MTSVKAALLSFAMLSAIVLCGLGIYSADAANNHNAVDGYGVTGTPVLMTVPGTSHAGYGVTASLR